MRSIRGRLTVLLLLGAGVLIAVASWMLHATLVTRLVREFDRSLLSRVEALAALSEVEPGKELHEIAGETMPEFQAPQRPEYFESWTADGQVLDRSPSLGEADLVRFSDPSTLPRFRDVVLPDGRVGRLVLMAVQPRKLMSGAVPGTAVRPTVIAVARGREALDHLIDNLRLALVSTAVALMVALSAMVWWSLRTGLRPLQEIARQVKALDERRLSDRLELASPPLELAPVVDQLNALLERLESAFDRERRFSSDVAHELRTPLAELRSIAEVGGGWPDDRELAARFFQDVNEIGLQMERIVVNLLGLARYDGGVDVVEASRFALGDLLETIWGRLEPEAETRCVDLECDLPRGLTLFADAGKLELILVNLLTNAVAYSPEGSTARVSARTRGIDLRLTVSNPADGLTPADLPFLFDRFWRKDSARSSGHHAGLGLSLVQALCRLLELSVEAEIDREGIFSITLCGAIASTPAAR